jgi:sugar phosphate isomerase/epimerase
MLLPLIALMLCSLTGGAQTGGNNSQVLGVQLYSFRNEMKQDVEGVLAKVKKMGFTEVEAAGYKWNSAAEFKAMLDKHGLKNVSFFSDYARMSSDLDGVITEARTLQSQYIIIGWIPHDGKKGFGLAETEKAIKDFNAWGARIAQAGLKFAYHVHGYEFSPHGNGVLLDKLLAETNPAHVFIELDVYWVAHPGHDPVKWMHKIGKRIHLMHMKDMQPGTRSNLTGHSDVETNVTVGTGTLNFPAIMKAAKQIGVKYLFIEDESSRSMRQVPQSASYLRKLIRQEVRSIR